MRGIREHVVLETLLDQMGINDLTSAIDVEDDNMPDSREDMALERDARAASSDILVTLGSGTDMYSTSIPIGEPEVRLDAALLACVLKPSDTRRAMDMFDPLKRGYFTPNDVRNIVHKIFFERKHLSATLRDRENMGSSIFAVADVVFWVIVSIVFLAVLNLDVVLLLTSYGSILLALSFAFGTSAQKLFESVIVTFFSRSFDVGDRILVGQDSTTPLVVERMSLRSTSAYAADGRLFIIPNHTLTDTQIINFKRSKLRPLVCNLELEDNVTSQQISNMRTLVEQYVSSRSSFSKMWDMTIQQAQKEGTIAVLISVHMAGVTWQDLGKGDLQGGSPHSHISLPIQTNTTRRSLTLTWI
eukprot:TRINITY_DN16106_c0_g1_i3.p1 TRINITY_DN16106_c0_g1~~TRINITY_DN16106_c0_g1_i3.p1  ORF type:complete len:358 (+),score=43.59 TRINITY_DN16106_c0_g1_i3:845-1918(+)